VAIRPVQRLLNWAGQFLHKQHSRRDLTLNTAWLVISKCPFACCKENKQA
jgi:hypothetical protein